ncbi:hypothetical protein EVAR_17573_1 [Eumeta japonica]|uniref:Uncharacterized protein n=1 Tax=Eumeta variegata TaxID=151549 RepID=A0A4C1UDB6_EUMVA|nr:hypothetical protein EVAR_17573_1 [Eumeta japonica]
MDGRGKGRGIGIGIESQSGIERERGIGIGIEGKSGIEKERGIVTGIESESGIEKGRGIGIGIESESGIETQRGIGIKFADPDKTLPYPVAVYSAFRLLCEKESRITINDLGLGQMLPLRRWSACVPASPVFTKRVEISRRKKITPPAQRTCAAAAQRWRALPSRTGFDSDNGRIKHKVFFLNLSHVKPFAPYLGEHAKPSVPEVVIALTIAIGNRFS